MSLMNWFRKRPHEVQMNEAQIKMLERLKANRTIAAMQIVPASMQNEFLKSVYPDDHLKSIVTGAYDTSKVADNLIMTYLDYAVRLSLSIQGFGLRLIYRHRIDPDGIAKIMLTGLSA